MKKNRNKMPVSERAKQFMPFAALKGYEEALRHKEKIIVPKSILTEDAADVLNRRLAMTQVGDVVTVIYYSGEEYLRLTGIVSKIDLDQRMIKIVNTKIPLKNLYDLRGENLDRFI